VFPHALIVSLAKAPLGVTKTIKVATHSRNGTAEPFHLLTSSPTLSDKPNEGIGGRV
jgi:hypothetical protein